MSNIQVFLSTLETKGNLAYEYNPFHNYQTNVDLYKYETDIGTVIAPASDKVIVLKNGLILRLLYGNTWEDKYGNKYNPDMKPLPPTASRVEKYASAGSLIDLDTEQLNFDLEHPVDIEVQPSYDGSVNLILNDDKNIPRLINSRFSVREKGTYEIVDRIGENDTNIYSSDTFEKDTSLYFQYKSNPTVQFTNFISGILPVGSYYFCFAYCDADDNESDYIAESGLIPVFLGNDGDPNSMVGGIKNQNSHKGIKLKLQNLDDAYTYLKIYYVRYFADYQQNRVYEAKKIYKKYPINSGTVYLQITGNEQAEDIDANILNISRFNPHHLLTQAQCKNMLFFGNIVKNADNYRELQDCALRIIPKVIEKTFQPTGTDYVYPGYYTSINMYNNVGYFNKEYYRFGVVFIYENGTLSNVYNTLGYDIVESKNNNITYNNKGCMYEESDNQAILVRKYIKSDDEGWIKNFSDFFNLGEDIPSNTINSKGVIKLNKKYTSNKILGIQFNIPNEVIKFLKETLHIRGLFFVRQKCIPSTIAQCYLLPMDEVLKAPVLKVGDLYQTESFITRKKTLTNDYNQRLYAYNGETSTENKISKHAYAAICPDFLLDQPYYNQIFNGSSFKLNQITDSNDFHRSDRFYIDGNTLSEDASNTINPTVSICSVTEDVPTVAIKDSIYKLQIGEAEEAFRFGFVEYDNSSMDNENNGTDKKENYYFNIIRGKYSPYLAIYSDVELTVNSLYDIMYDQQNPIQEFKNRMDSFEPFYAISNRYNFEQLEGEGDSDKSIICFRGDCYLNTFTYRLNRNFNDPTLPSNDEIIDPNTWKDHYKLDDPTEWTKISRSDVNAIQMGSWITFQVRSAMNYALRSEDASNVAEAALMGQPRSFYPKNKLLFRGNNKIPDSYVFNDAYRATLGFKCYFTLNDINYIKDTFSNRIQYSAISVQDSYKNNYRYSLSTYFRDYSQEYGSITKLVGFEGYLLVIFEHGIGIAVINERILAGQGDGEPVFINTKNVLPEELTIISDTIGTQWGESVVKSEAGYVYGVDTIAKKIWRVKSQQLEIISDFKVNKFLVDNITLGERENHPYIALKNVKTHYNNNKKDIMFTFYDDVYKEEEKVWNLCYNEYLDEFVTFYSWVPSYSANIDTSFFSFNRETSKALSLLEKSNYYNLNNYGVLLEYPVIDDTNEDEITYPKLHYRVKHRTSYYTIKEGQDGTVENIEHNVGQGDFEKEPEFSNFVIEFSQYGWNKYFEVVNYDNEYKIRLKPEVTLEDIKNMMKENNSKVIILNITPQINKIENQVNALNDITKFRTETVAFTFKSIVQNVVNLDELNLTTDFFVHGQGGIYDLKENIYPTHWYGETHPFEFEFVVNEQIAYQKVFTNLIIISNKAEPESFHFEIEGDNYEFSSDKRTMYFRQESTKKLFQRAGSDILYDRKYEDVAAKLLTKEQYYRKLDGDYQNQYTDFKNYHGVDRTYPIKSGGLTQQVKSTIFPLYYKRIDKYNYIYDKYQELVSDGKNYQNLSGSEIIWNRDLNQFNIVTHIKNSPIDHYGRLRGNSFYKEGKWNIQIPSLNFMQKNERQWTDGTPPIIVQYLPEGVNVINGKDVADTYDGILDIKNPSEYAIAENWTYRKEAKIRDKWIKIRVRYSGYNLAVIHSLVTLFNLSYS